MDSYLQTFLSQWSWRWLTLAILLSLAIFYLNGWLIVRRSRQTQIEPDWPIKAQHSHLILFFLALLLYFVALISPLHKLAVRFFSLHVLQHLLLVSLIPLMLLIVDPAVVIKIGIHGALKRPFLQLYKRFSFLSSWLFYLTKPFPSFFIFTAVFWIWYDPTLRQAAIDIGWVHHLETAVLAVVALPYWRNILNVAPRLHEPLYPLARIIYTAIGTWPIKLVGVVLLFLSEDVYHYPSSAAFSILMISDQNLGSTVIWLVGGVVFTWTSVLLMHIWIGQESEKPPLPEEAWAKEDVMLAPGFFKSE